MADTKNVLVIGSGGREHALTWKLLQDPNVQVYVAPGNAGTSAEPNAYNIDLAAKPENFAKIAEFIKDKDISMVVVGPEDPLDKGIVDYLAKGGYHNVIGPAQNAAQLESDKFFSFDVMGAVGIPQAEGVKCYSTQEAIDFIRSGRFEQPVLKARGLTGGKGVTVCSSIDEALAEITGHASSYGEHVLVSKKLYGQEFSVFGLSDGERVRILNAAFQDHKPRDNGDTGVNTGGMGAYGPAPIATLDDLKEAEFIMNRLVTKMHQDGIPYKNAWLYGGFMKTEEGIKVIEWNIRFGDPECQPAMMIMNGDLYTVHDLTLKGGLHEADLSVRPGYSTCVVMAAPTYPTSGSKGKLIKGLAEVAGMPGVKVFHAGTARNEDGEVVTNGGRILGVTSYDADFMRSQELAYRAKRVIIIEGGSHSRDDVGDKAHALLRN